PSPNEQGLATGPAVGRTYNADARELYARSGTILTSVTRPFEDFHAALSKMEDHFLSVVYPQGKRQLEILRLFGASETFAIEIGLGWALWLTGLLRAFFVWMETAAFLVGLPWRRIYDAEAGTLAAALMERILGVNLSNPNGLRPSTYYPAVPYAV